MLLMDHLSKRDELAEDQPEVDHLGVGGEGQLLHHACEDCRHHQHVGQVHRKSYDKTFVSFNPSVIPLPESHFQTSYLPQRKRA